MKRLTILIILTMTALGISALGPQFAMGGVSISTTSPQTFDVSDGEKDCAAITITKTSGSPSITASYGINIRIPDSLGIQWAGVDLGNAGQSNPVAFSLYGTHVSSWDLNMNAGTITLHFDSIIDSSSFVTGSVTIQSAAGTSPSASYTLTNGSTPDSPDGQDITITLSATDLNAIKVIENFAKNASNSYLSIAAAAFTDSDNYTTKAILPVSAKAVTNYTPDATDPDLSGWALDMNAHTLTLNFNEPVDRSTLLYTSLRLQNTVSGPTKSYNLTNSSSVSPDGMTIVVNLSAIDFNALVDYAGGGLCTEAGNSYLTSQGGYTIMDMASRPLADITTGISASPYTANTVSAAQFHVTTASPNYANQTTVTAGSNKGIAIKAYDASNYRTPTYTGDKTLVFSGAASSADPVTAPTATDNSTPPVPISFTSPATITFANGEGSSTIVLYNKETALVKAAEGTAVTTDNAYGLTVTVNPDVKTKLAFTTQPPSSSPINHALVPQPVVAIRDQYGNRTTDTDTIRLDASTSGSSFSYISGLSIVPNTTPVTVNAVDGAASFAGVQYTKEGTIYLYATSPTSPTLTNVFSGAATFATAVSSTVEAADSPEQNAPSITPTNDTVEEKFSVLKFKIKDAGDDGTATLVDRIKIDVTGTGANASTDIAWAELRASDGGDHQIAIATSIANDYITFGGAPDAGSDGDLDTVADGTAVEYTVNIYMKPSKLTAVDNNAYIFDTDESLIGLDTGLSSRMTADSEKIISVIKQIIVNVSHFEVVKESDGASTISTTAGLTSSLSVRATDANKNIDKDYTGMRDLIFSGLSTVGVNAPKVGETPFGEVTTVIFATGISSSNSINLKAYAKEVASVSVAEQNVSPAYSVFSLQATVDSAAPYSVNRTSGNLQSAVALHDLANPLVVTVRDQYGNPVNAGTAVTFRVTNPAGTTTSAKFGNNLGETEVATGPNGQASANLTLGNLNGQYQVTAESLELAGTKSVSFTATATIPAALSITGGNNQSAVVGQPLTLPLKVKLTDNSPTPQPVTGETINFAIYIDGGSKDAGALLSAPDVTDSNGEAQVTLTLGTETGVNAYIVRAAYTGLAPQDFTVTATNDVPYKAVLTGPPSVNAGAASGAFTITVKDQYDNASNISGDDMTFNIVSTPDLGAFYGDAPCIGGTITTRSVMSGANAASFYFKSAVTGISDITIVTADGRLNADYRTGAIAGFTVTPKDLDHFTVTASDTSTITVGGSRTLTITGYDNLNNNVTSLSSVSVIFSGASVSQSGNAATCSNSSGSDIAFGSATSLTFSGGVATTTFKPYKAENAQIAATSGAATSSPLNLTVKHGATRHVKFHDNIPSSWRAGSRNTFNTTLDVVDAYWNICDAENGAAYNGSDVVISWALSGTSNAPDSLTGTDTYTNSVSFTNGRSEPTTPALGATLYRAQTTTITPGIAAIDNTPEIASNTITVSPAVENPRLRFEQKLPNDCISKVSSQVFIPTLEVSLADPYGNIRTDVITGGTITLASSTTQSDPGVSTVNGALSATGGLAKAISNGVATFTDLKYSYPEMIYVRASAANITGATVSNIYSDGITFEAVKELAVSSVATNATVSSIANTSTERAAVFAFKVTDAGTDGLDGIINKVVIRRSASDGTGSWTDYINSAALSDGTITATGAPGADTITFGTDTDPIFSVPNGSSSVGKTYTLRIALKTTLPAGADGKVIGFTMDADTDITLSTAGSSNFPDAVDAVAADPTIDVLATNLVVAGTGTMNAGTPQVITITAEDKNRNIDKDYNNTGVGKNIKFSGASSALDVGGTVAESGGEVTPDGVVYYPTCTNYNVISNIIKFDEPTAIKFTSGVSSSTITMRLYKSETAVIIAEDTDVSQNYKWVGLASAPSPAVGRLNVTVSGGDASKLSWGTQPKAKAVANAPWAQFAVKMTDVYGNTASSTADVTIGFSGDLVLTPGAVKKVAAQGGVATFNNFAVYATSYIEGSFGPFTLTASGAGFSTLPSNAVTLDEKYTIAFDAGSVIDTFGNPVTGFTFLMEYVNDPTPDDNDNDVEPISSPAVPFSKKLPYGAYIFSFDKSMFVPLTMEKTACVSEDATDGVYDNVIHWKAIITSTTEATADYRVMSSFVYDENTKSLSVRLWLERRGKVIASSETNKFGSATIEVYEPDETMLPAITLLAPTEGYTYKVTLPNILNSGNDFHKALESGKTYFVRCKIDYGGELGDRNSYEGGTTFTVTVTQQLSNEIIDKIGVAPDQTLAGMLTGVSSEVTGVSAAVSAVSTKVDTQAAVTQAKVDAVNTQVAATDVKVSGIGTTVGSIQTDVSTTLPDKVKTELAKGVISEMLTRNTVLREDDSVKIRYRTATGLVPTLTIYNPDGAILPDYNFVKMKEISNTGIYEYEVTARDSWGVGDFTAVCSESTKNSTDSMVLTIKALYTAGAGVEESVDAVGEAVSKVYTRQKSMEGLLGTPTDTKSKSTILGKVNGLNTTMDSLNLTTVSADAKNARINAQNVYNEIENITKGIADVKAQAAALKELSKQLEEMKLNLSKTSQGLTAEIAASGTATQVPSTVSVGTTTITTASGGGDTTIVNQYVTASPAVQTRYSSYSKNYAPGTYRTKVSVSEGAVSVADYDLNGIIVSTEKRLFDGQSSTIIGRIGKALEALKAQASGTGTGSGSGIGAGGAKDSDVKDLSNRLEELTALVSVLSRMIETTTNKPIVEGWFEQS